MTMTEPVKEFEEQSNFGKPLTKAQTALIKPTSESSRKPKQKMLDEEDDETNNTLFETLDKDFTSLFDDPEKL